MLDAYTDVFYDGEDGLGTRTRAQSNAYGDELLDQPTRQHDSDEPRSRDSGSAIRRGLYRDRVCQSRLLDDYVCYDFHRGHREYSKKFGQNGPSSATSNEPESGPRSSNSCAMTHYRLQQPPGAKYSELSALVG